MAVHPADLNVVWENDKDEMKKKLSMCIRLGYRHIAINYIVENLTVKTGKKNKKNKDTDIREPASILPSETDIKDVKAEWGVKEPVHVYSRITVVLSQSDQTSRLQKDPSIRAYQVISCQPTTDKLLHMACSSLSVDLISLDLTEKLPCPIKRAMVRSASQRGVSFEVPYTNLLSDVSRRRLFICNARELLSVTKCKSVVLTSAAEQASEFRAPNEVQALMAMLDVSAQNTQKMQRDNCIHCLTHSETCGKRPARGVVRIHNYPRISAPQEEDGEADKRAIAEWTGEGSQWYWHPGIMEETRAVWKFMFGENGTNNGKRSNEQGSEESSNKKQKTDSD